MSSMHTFEKRQYDRCQHRSAVKNTPPPSPSLPVPIPPPHHTHHPSANCPGPMISGRLDHVTSSANGCGAPGAQQRQSVPFRSLPPLPLSCPALPGGDKSLQLHFPKTTAILGRLTAKFFTHAACFLTFHGHFETECFS
jgi:hypothetical protein